MIKPALVRGLDRGLRLLRKQAAAGAIDTWWEVELCIWQDIRVQENLYEMSKRQIATALEHTAYFDGDGPWHGDRRGRALYAIEHTHNAVAIATTFQLLGGPRRAALIGWLESMIGPDGAVDTRAEYERIESLRRPDDAAARRARLAAAWRKAMPSREVPEPRGPCSALEDAWYLVDTLVRLGRDDRLAQIAAWVQTCQRQDGAFRAPIGLWPTGAPYGSSLADTAWALRTLAAAGEAPRDKAACIRWLEARATTVYPTDLVAWLDLVESMVTLGARDRIAPEDVLAIGDIEIERDPDAPRASFDTHAAARILHLLESGRPRAA